MYRAYRIYLKLFKTPTMCTYKYHHPYTLRPFSGIAVVVLHRQIGQNILKQFPVKKKRGKKNLKSLLILILHPHYPKIVTVIELQQINQY